MPSVLDGGHQHRALLVALREQLLQLRQRQSIPDAPTNVKVTAGPFMNTLQFTRSADADYYEVMHSPTANLLDARVQITDIGNSALWQDHVGNSGITVFYWVRARKRSGASSLEVGPVKATTLAAAAGVTPPNPPPPANIMVKDQVTGRVIAYSLSRTRSDRW